MTVEAGSEIPRVASLRTVQRFQEHLQSLRLTIPCDQELAVGAASSFAQPLLKAGFKIGNRITIHPMEGWDGTTDGNPGESTIRRWQRFGRSGAKLIWGGEAVAVRNEGRANPNQLVIADHTLEGLAHLRRVLIDAHRQRTGSVQGLVIGLQLTHSGRYSRPTSKLEPRILYRHPILDKRLGLAPDYPLLTDGEIEGIIEDFQRAGRLAQRLGFDFVDVKHCHGYLGHEFLSAHTREGRYGGSFENRTRFLRDVTVGIRSAAPGLQIGVRLSAFDAVPFRPDPDRSTPSKLGPGVPEPHEQCIPYRWGFGVNPQHPTQADLMEPIRFLSLLEDMDIRLVNLTAGSPYYNPHIQRPALFPPSDGYQPPEDPLTGVARQMEMVHDLKQRFPNLIIVGSAYTYLQDFLPHVAQGALREGWVDSVGLGRVVLSYPEVLWDAMAGRTLKHKLVCRTFSDCTTAPRNGLPSGCYPLDDYYKESEAAQQLKAVKAPARKG